MHGNFRPSQWKEGLQHRADMVFTRLDCSEEIPSTVDGTHPLSVNSERAGEVAVGNEIDQRLAIFRRGCRVLRFIGLHFEFRVLRSAASFRYRYRRFILTERTARQYKDRGDGLHDSLQSYAESHYPRPRAIANNHTLARHFHALSPE